jgi:ribonuclease HII
MIAKKLDYPFLFFEKKAWDNSKLVCGIDEVGRGCLAGPVVVAAVILPANTKYALLKDSKIMNAADREKAYCWIIQNCAWSIALANHRTIDACNIYKTTQLTMKKAYVQLIEQLPCSFEQLVYVVIDAMPLDIEKPFRHPDLEIHHFNYGESISPSIAAASIIAKVTRDRLMERLHPLFPSFAFDQHKGYGTKQHLSALHSQGPTIMHRTSFIKNIMNPSQEDEQRSLF